MELSGGVVQENLKPAQAEMSKENAPKGSARRQSLLFYKKFKPIEIDGVELSWGDTNAEKHGKYSFDEGWRSIRKKLVT
jgi:hypothetical protein